MKYSEWQKRKEEESDIEADYRKALRKYRENFIRLQYALQDENQNETLRSEAAALAEETGITFWYEKYTGIEHERTTWEVYIPKSIEKFEHILLDYRAAPHDIRTFLPGTNGDSDGSVIGEWFHSHSC